MMYNLLYSTLESYFLTYHFIVLYCYNRVVVVILLEALCRTLAQFKTPFYYTMEAERKHWDVLSVSVNI